MMNINNNSLTLHSLRYAHTHSLKGSTGLINKGPKGAQVNELKNEILNENIQSLTEKYSGNKIMSTGILSDYLKSQKSIISPIPTGGEVIYPKGDSNKGLEGLKGTTLASLRGQAHYGFEGKEGDTTQYLNSLTKFNRGIANNQFVLYQFNKANNKPYKFLFDKTSKLLKVSFLAMGCLISKPVFKVTYTQNNLEFENNISKGTIQGLKGTVPALTLNDSNNNKKLTKLSILGNTQKILIDLSYFIRKNNNRYLNNNIELNENILNISHLDNEDTLRDGSVPSLRPEINGHRRNNILCKYNDKFQYLTDYLNSIFRSEVELNLVRLPKVFYDSNILVQDLALKSYRYRFVKLVSRLFSKVHIQNLEYANNLVASFPSYLSGINIKLAGRTFRQRVIPRMTVKRIQKGSLTNVNVQFIEKARFTGKTRRGSFSFTVTLGHVFK